MCYFNGQKVTRAEYIRLKQLEREIKKYNFLNQGVIDGFTDAPIAVLVPTENKTNFDIVQMEWGYAPHYIEDREALAKLRNGYMDNGKWIQGKPNLNVKSENLFKSENTNRPSIFKEGAVSGRCLVLSTGFFEWQHVFRANKITGKPVKKADTYPYYIGLKDHAYFYMAGVYRGWTDRLTGEHVNTVAIVTAPANHLMTHIHNSKKRMPTILTDELAWKWMMEELSEAEIMEVASTQHDWEQMEYCTVAKDFKAKLEPEEHFMYQELPALELSLQGVDEPRSTGQQTSLF